MEHPGFFYADSSGFILDFRNWGKLLRDLVELAEAVLHAGFGHGNPRLFFIFRAQFVQTGLRELHAQLGHSFQLFIEKVL